MILTEIIESTRLAIDQIRVSKLRSLLSALGVVIGISVVIIMGWLVMSLNNVVESTFQMMGTDMMWVSRWDWAGSQTWEEMRNRKEISYKMAQDFKDRMTAAEHITIQASEWAQSLKYNSETYSGMSAESGDEEFQYTYNAEIEEGRYFSQTELEIGSNAMILGNKVYTSIFPDSNALGKVVTLKGRKFTIVGVFKKKGTVMMDFVDNVVCIPENTFFKLYGKSNQEFDIGIKAGSVESMENARYEAEGVMRTLRNLKPGQKNDFSINEAKVFEEMTQTIRAAVFGVGIGMTMLSFIVGIIGIMNIMFVSVTERTKEIGIRKAVGANARSILLQFVIEAAALCLLGAIIAFAFSSVIIILICQIAPSFSESLAEILTPYLPLNILVIATIISILVGIIAGLLPAMRAAKLPPIDALRWE